MKIKALLISFFLLFQFAPSCSAVYGGESASGSVKVLGFLENKDSNTTICSGALISSRIAVSVAHCFLNRPNMWALTPGESTSNSSKVFKVEKVVFVPGYKWSWNPETHDLGGLKDDFVFVIFAEDVVVNYHVDIANKEDVKNIKENKSPLVLYGYGLTSNNSKSGNPRKVKSMPRLKSVSGSEQWSSYPSEDKVLGFTEELKNSTCSGDSGGPVYSGDKIVAVMNTGNGCGPTEVANGGMSTLIYQYLYLISDIYKQPSKISLDNLDPDLTSTMSYSKINNFSDAQNDITFRSNLFLSPTVGNRPYKLYLEGLEKSVKFWSPIYKNPEFSIVLFTEEDSEWVDAIQTRLMGKSLINPKQQLQSFRIKESGCNIGGFYYPSIIMFCVKTQSELSSNSIHKYSALHAFPHEFTHLVAMWSPEASVFPYGTNQRLLPCWINEGFATFFGIALGASTQDPLGSNRLEFFNSLTYPYDMKRNQEVGTIKKLLLKNDPSVVINLFRELEVTMDTCSESQNAYVLGGLATEAIVATYGAESVIKFQQEFGKTGNWKPSFQKVFGVSSEEFYTKITPYLASQAKKFDKPSLISVPTPKPIPAPTATAEPTPEPTQQSVTLTRETLVEILVVSVDKKIKKQTSITCYKNKSTKKVTGFNPVCPKGWTKK